MFLDMKMKPYICKIHGAVEPYVYDRSSHGMVPLRGCRLCRREANHRCQSRPGAYRERYERHGAAQRAAEKVRIRKRKEKIVAGYGGACECCGETTFEFLTIDHMRGGGNVLRQTTEGGGALYRRLIREGFPRGEHQLLCMNCNHAKGIYGHCPHEVAAADAAA